MTDAKDRARTTYDAAADTYDDPALSFWDRFGRRTVERLGLRPGERVLDVCCGSGASALAAAERVGPEGHVLGADLSANLLGLARAKARSRGLSHAEFRLADLENLGLRDAPGDRFDAVVCVFGVFFLPDMAGAVRELWRRVKPGGRLAITTWGRDVFEPMNGAFWESIRAERPDLFKSFNPWDRISDPEGLKALLHEAGVEEAECVPEAADHALQSPGAWWRVVMGSGYRGTVDQLEPPARERVRAANLRYAETHDVRSIRAGVVYALARKPATCQRTVPSTPTSPSASGA